MYTKSTFVCLLAVLVLASCVNRKAQVVEYFEKHKTAFDSLATQLPPAYASSGYNQVTITPGDIENPALHKSMSGLDVVNISLENSPCDTAKKLDKVYFQLNKLGCYYIYSRCPVDTTDGLVQLNPSWYYVLTRK